MAPTKEALQEMLHTCHEYAQEYGLKFSTNPDPVKSKTKCLSFLKRDENLEKLKLGNDPLPWVQHGKHLGNTLENIVNGFKKDILIKRAQYIDKNNETNQEFSFAHPDSKFKLNMIYNSHFTGSPLWDLFSRECQMLENSWSVSFRCKYNLPRSTHRYFMESITEMPHLKQILIKRFLSFVEQIKSR